MALFSRNSAKARVGRLEKRVPRMSFLVTDEYPDKTLSVEGKMIVGKAGNRFVYSLNATGAGRGWMEHAALVKMETIEKMLQFPETTYEKRFEDAKEIAQELVCESHSGDREIISWAVAHDVAGHGPLSMLIDNRNNIEEIVVNSPNSNIAIYHSNYGYCTTNMKFLGEREFI